MILFRAAAVTVTFPAVTVTLLPATRSCARRNMALTSKEALGLLGLVEMRVTTLLASTVTARRGRQYLTNLMAGLKLGSRGLGSGRRFGVACSHVRVAALAA